MNTTQRAKAYVKEAINKNPSLRDDIMDFYYLFVSEIEDEGASPEHEYNLMVGSIEDLLNETSED